MSIYNNSYVDSLLQKITRRDLLIAFFCFILSSVIMVAMYLWCPLKYNVSFSENGFLAVFFTVVLVQLVICYWAFSSALSKVQLPISATEKLSLFIFGDSDPIISAGVGTGFICFNVLGFSQTATEYQQFLQACAEEQDFATTKELVNYASGILGHSPNKVILLYAGILAAFSFLWFIVLKLSRVVHVRFTKALCKITPVDTVTIVLKDSGNISLDVTKEQLLFYKGFVIIGNKEHNPFKIYKESEVEKITISNNSKDCCTNLTFNQTKQEWETVY